MLLMQHDIYMYIFLYYIFRAFGLQDGVLRVNIAFVAQISPSATRRKVGYQGCVRVDPDTKPARTSRQQHVAHTAHKYV